MSRCKTESGYESGDRWHHAVVEVLDYLNGSGSHAGCGHGDGGVDGHRKHRLGFDDRGGVCCGDCGDCADGGQTLDVLEFHRVAVDADDARQYQGIQ